MSLLLGVDARLYYLPVADGPRASWGTLDTATGITEGVTNADLDPINIVKDISFPIEKDEADVTTRASHWKATKGTVQGVSIDIPMVYDVSDAGLVALQTAFLTSIPIALAVLDGDVATTGTKGLWADFEVTKMEKGEMIADVQTLVFTVKPCYGAVPPEWIEVVAA